MKEDWPHAVLFHDYKPMVACIRKAESIVIVIR